MHIDNNKRYFYCGGGDTIGKSFYLFNYQGYNLGIDFGGGYGSFSEQPRYDKNRRLDSLFITHAHYDHNGMVPCLVKINPDIVVYCTEPTFDISLHQWEQTVRYQGDKSPYSFDDVEAIKRRIKIISNGTEIQLRSGLSVFPQNSGHILGSSSLLIKSGDNHRTFVTSDICFQDRHLIKGAQMPDYKVDLLVREFTYGTVDDFEPRQDVIDRFIASIREKLAKGAKILIPALSVDRLQDIYAILKEAEIPAYLDCSQVVSQIYVKHLGKEAEFLLQAKRLEGKRNREDLFRSRDGFVVVASSGMINRKTISSWWAEKLAPNKNNAIFTVNYMDPGSQGGELVSTDQGRFLVLNGISVLRNCAIESFNFSAHMSGSDGLELERKLNPKQIIYGHYGSVDVVSYHTTRQKDNTKRTIAEVGRWEEI